MKLIVTIVPIFVAHKPFLTSTIKNNAMNRSLLKLVMLFLCIQLLSCSDDDNLPIVDSEVLIDDVAYNSAQTDNYTINSIRLEGDILIVNFSSSGCDGSSWEVKLIDSGGAAYSNPPQRFLALTLENNEECEAFFTKELAFDISALRLSNSSVWLNVKNYEEGILYQY
jgi:hypothetical protein